MIAHPAGDDDWPTLDEAAFHGLAGEVVSVVEPHSEADPVAMLVTLLVGFGACVGRGAHASADGAEHAARLSVVIVGDTAKARKGTSYQRVEPFLAEADAAFVAGRVLKGFGSGEALVDEVRDAGEDGSSGTADKRLLLYEPEFAQILRVASRDGSTLSTRIRDAWDGSRLEARSRGAGKVVATGHHIAILGHITTEELRRLLTDTETASGFANRILFVCARRSKRLPFGGDVPTEEASHLGRRLAERLDVARTVGRVDFAPDARSRWEALYEEMYNDDPGGLLGQIVARPEAQTLRLAVLYCLLDGAHVIERGHLEAAWAVWRYARASAAYIFGDAVGDSVADKLLKAIRGAGAAGLDRTGQSRALSGNIPAKRLQAARQVLEARGSIITKEDPEPTGGRSRMVSYAITNQDEGTK